MAIEAIVGGVYFAADKPFRERKFPFQDFVEGLEPVPDSLRAFAPEFFRILLGATRIAHRNRSRLLIDARARQIRPAARNFRARSRSDIGLDRHGQIGHQTPKSALKPSRALRAFSDSNTMSRRRRLRADSNGFRAAARAARARYWRANSAASSTARAAHRNATRPSGPPKSSKNHAQLVSDACAARTISNSRIRRSRLTSSATLWRGEKFLRATAGVESIIGADRSGERTQRICRPAPARSDRRSRWRDR